jgi:hypothetical protein
MLVWTDGGENFSVANSAAVTAACVANRVTPFVLQYGWSFSSAETALVSARTIELQAICAATGGQLYDASTPALIDDAMADIEDNFITPAIPTLSQWGMIVLAVLILASAVILLRKRRKALST